MKPLNPVNKTNVGCIILLVGAVLARCQGTFQNLDFEHPVLPLVPDSNFMVAISNALPGWTGYIGGTSVSSILYDTRALDAAAISIQDATSSMQPIQGNYSVFLQGASVFAPQESASIAQVGQVPASARSILFYFKTGSGLQVTFSGQVVPLVQVGSTSSYSIMGGDISAFAGLTGELRFTALPSVGSGMLDQIQFSNLAVPEPTVFGLLAVVVGICWFRLARWGRCRSGS